MKNLKRTDNLKPWYLRLLRCLVKFTVTLLLLLAFIIFAVDRFVAWNGSTSIYSKAELKVMAQNRKHFDCIIVPGAQVLENTEPSQILKARLNAAIDLYHSGVSDKILVSGDHREDNYNEVGVMKDYLEAAGIPSKAIYCDHFGLDTYSTVYRAKAVFQVKSAIMTTQRFQLERALFIAHSLNFDMQGLISDNKKYPLRNYLREYGARFKAIYEVVTKKIPDRMDPIRSITGDAAATHEPWGEPWESTPAETETKSPTP